jgi:hypothetical protein
VPLKEQVPSSTAQRVQVVEATVDVANKVVDASVVPDAVVPSPAPPPHAASNTAAQAEAIAPMEKRCNSKLPIQDPLANKRALINIKVNEQGQSLPYGNWFHSLKKEWFQIVARQGRAIHLGKGSDALPKCRISRRKADAE